MPCTPLRAPTRARRARPCCAPTRRAPHRPPPGRNNVTRVTPAPRPPRTPRGNETKQGNAASILPRIAMRCRNGGVRGGRRLAAGGGCGGAAGGASSFARSSDLRMRADRPRLRAASGSRRAPKSTDQRDDHGRPLPGLSSPMAGLLALGYAPIMPRPARGRPGAAAR